MASTAPTLWSLLDSVFDADSRYRKRREACYQREESLSESTADDPDNINDPEDASDNEDNDEPSEISDAQPEAKKARISPNRARRHAVIMIVSVRNLHICTC